MAGRPPVDGVAREPWRPVVLLAGSLTVLVTLYLPWRQGSCGSGCFGRTAGIAGLRDQFLASLHLDGWSTGSAQFVALSAVLLAALASAALVRPTL